MRGPGKARRVRRRSEDSMANQSFRVNDTMFRPVSTPFEHCLKNLMHQRFLGQGSVKHGQFCPCIGDENSEQAGWFSCARVLANQMLAAFRFKETLACMVNPDRAGRGILGTNRTREDKYKNTAGVFMLARFSAPRIAYLNGCCRL